MEDIEIEIKVTVEHIEPLHQFLKKNATFEYKTVQVDEYFTPAHRNFLKGNPMREWLRLRKADGKSSINYKYYHYDDKGMSTYCDEYETEVKDIKAMEKIFKALNVEPQVIVHKERNVWKYKDFEIALDTVKTLGEFIEIEYKGKTMKDPLEVRKEMVKFLKDISVGRIMADEVGYPSILLFPKDRKQIEM